MNVISRSALSIVILAATLLAGCVSMRPAAVWKDPGYQAHPAKIMVIGVSKNPLNRRLFEDEFVLHLKSRGTEAIASYTVLPDKQQDDQAVIAEKVKESGADTVLISRLVSRKTVQYYVPGTVYFPPPFYDTWPNYYGYGYSHMYSPGYVAEEEYAVIETNLYDTRNDKLVWAASTETGLDGSDANLIKSYIGVMVGEMAESGLVGK